MFNILSSAASNAGATAFLGLIGGFYTLMVGLYCVIFLFGLLSFVIWLWLLIDCLKRENYDGPNDKILWAIVIIFTHIIGAILYYFVIKTKKDLPKTAN